jgi:hypothetical protein
MTQRHEQPVADGQLNVNNAESVLPALVKAEIGTQHISSLSWAASLALLDLSGDCLIRLLRAGPW